jgi:hypothetical protein
MLRGSSSETFNRPSVSRKHAADWVIPLCLTAFFLYVSSRLMGISMADDSYYLQSGAGVSASTFLHFQSWGPLYSLWFKALHFVCPNPISRYFLSWGLLVTLIGLLPAWMKMPSAWLYSFLILIFPVLTVTPYVSHFAAVIVLFSTCVLLRQQRAYSTAAAAACLVSFILAFARPEFSYGVYFSAVATVLMLGLEALPANASTAAAPRRRPLRLIGLGLTVVTLSAAMIFITGQSRKTSRSGMAFAQHFNWRAMQRGLLAPGPDVWSSNYAERRFGIDAGHSAANGTATIADFFHANPRLFLDHISRNLIDPKTIVFLLFLAIVLTWPWLGNSVPTLRAISLFLLLLCLPPVAGILLIYPREHYPMIVLPALVLYTVQLLQVERWRRPSTAWVLVVGCALIWLLNIGLDAHGVEVVQDDRSNLSRVRCLYAIDQSTSSANPAVFDAAGTLDVYFPHTRVSVYPAALPTWAQFQAWATHTQPAWISTDAALAKQYALTPNQLDDYLRNDLGYHPHPCPFAAQLTVYTGPAPSQ